MKIAFLLTQSLESPSGLGRYGPLGRELARLGHEVNVIALHPDFSSLQWRRYVMDGVHIHYVAPMHVQKRGSVKSYYPAYKLLPLAVNAAWQLSRAALETPADIVHVGKPHPMNSIAGLVARVLGGRRLFLDCDDYEAGSGRFSGSWQKGSVAFFEKWMPGRADLVTTNTFFMQEHLREWKVPAERLVYLPNGVERGRFKRPDGALVEKLRAHLGLTGKKVVIFIGSLSLPSHPVDLLLDAFIRLRRSEPEAALVVVGGGEDYEGLQQLASASGIGGAVRFCGRIEPDQVPLYYSVAHVSIDPVYDDDAARGRSPLKLFESWASGIPFITADVGDRRVLSGEPPAALLARPGDPAALAAAIKEVLGNRGLAEGLRQRGLERVENYYWDRLAKNLEAVYLSHYDH